MTNHQSDSVNVSQVKCFTSEQDTGNKKLLIKNNLKVALTIFAGALAIGCITAIVVVPCVIVLSTKSSPNTSVTVNSLGIYNLNIPTCATWNQTAITVAGNSNGSSGTDLASLASPTSIFVDNSNTLYISERDNNRITKYFAGATTGIVVAGNLIASNAANSLNAPKGVAVDQSGSIIVADSGNYRIQKFSSGSTIGFTLVTDSTLNPLGTVRGLYIDAYDNLYAADTDNDQIVKYPSGSSVAVLLAGGNGSGLGANQLNNPFGSFMDGSGNLFVADDGNHRILKFPPGSQNGTVVAGISGIAGSLLPFIGAPAAVIVDNNGYIYLADSSNNQIIQWTGNYSAGGVCVVGCTGMQGIAANQLRSPRDLKFDRYGNLYVADQGNNRIQMFMIQIPSACPISG